MLIHLTVFILGRRKIVGNRSYNTILILLTVFILKRMRREEKRRERSCTAKMIFSSVYIKEMKRRMRGEKR